MAFPGPRSNAVGIDRAPVLQSRRWVSWAKPHTRCANAASGCSGSVACRPSIGDAIVPVALTFAVLSIHGSATALGSVLASFTVARVVFTLAGGVVADRFSRRTIMLSMRSRARRGAGVHRGDALDASHDARGVHRLRGAVRDGVRVLRPSRRRPRAPDDRARRAAGGERAARDQPQLAERLRARRVSGLLVAVAGAGYVFAIDAASFVASATFLAQLDIDAPIRAPLRSFGSELREGFGEVISRGWVRAPIIGFAISNFMFASFLVLGPLVFITHFGSPTRPGESFLPAARSARSSARSRR